MRRPAATATRRAGARCMERGTTGPASLDHPRAPRRAGGIPNFEMYAWLFMRMSGIVLVVLVLGHLLIMRCGTAACTGSTSASSRGAGPRRSGRSGTW